MGEEDETTTFGAADYAVFVVMLVVSALIGIYYHFAGNRQRTTRAYLVADKNMSVVPVAFSLMASFMSAITLLGVPSENYFFGTQYVLISVAYIVGTPIVAYLFLPVFYDLQVISVYEYVERRFGRATRLAMSATFIIQMVLYMAVVLYAPAVALSAVTGIPKWLCIISVGLVCTFYCTIGGMKAVLWTDLFQSILMFAAMFAVVGVGTHRMGGISNVWAEAEAGGRIEFWNLDPDLTVRHTVWSLAIGNIFLFVALYGVNQAQVQRLMTVGSLKKAQMAIYLNLPALLGLCFITSFAGIVMYANFRHCDPLMSGKITQKDQVLPYFVMLHLGFVKGLPGLFVAGIFSGSLSTVSSAVNSLVAVLLEDFMRPFCISQKTYDKYAVLILKVLAFFFGILCVLLTAVVEQFGGVLYAGFIIFGVVGGPVLGVFTLGLFCRKANQKAALLGFTAGLVMCSWIATGATLYQMQPKPLPLLVDGCRTSSEDASAVNITDMLYDRSDCNVTSTVATILSEGTMAENATSADVITDDTYVLPLYQLSYQWYSGLGWLIVVVVGSLVALLTRGADDVDPRLLSPLIRKSTERRKMSLSRADDPLLTHPQIPMKVIKNNIPA
ncbi:putative sodium-dependent multivitamin transporter [Haemaphysalis longicornis]